MGDVNDARHRQGIGKAPPRIFHSSRGGNRSLEKLVLDVEMLQHMMAFLDSIVIDDDTLAFKAMKDVPVGGHFCGTPHTLERYETAFYQPRS